MWWIFSCQRITEREYHVYKTDPVAENEQSTQNAFKYKNIWNSFSAEHSFGNHEKAAANACWLKEIWLLQNYESQDTMLPVTNQPQNKKRTKKIFEKEMQKILQSEKRGITRSFLLAFSSEFTSLQKIKWTLKQKVKRIKCIRENSGKCIQMCDTKQASFLKRSSFKLWPPLPLNPLPLNPLPLNPLPLTLLPLPVASSLLPAFQNTAAVLWRNEIYTANLMLLFHMCYVSIE